MEHLKSHFFFYLIIILIGLMVATSYYRFIVLQDYTVGYEGDCDPYFDSCYIYCEEWDDDDANNDDECAEPFYYSWMERNAGMIYSTCGGGDVTMCDAAYECTNGDDTCAIYFCDPEFEECDELTEADMTLEESFEPEIVEEITETSSSTEETNTDDSLLEKIMENEV